MDKTLSYYNSNAERFVQDTGRVDFTAIQDRFLERLPAGGRILDFGCGSGRDSAYFFHRGFCVDAVDGSEALCRLAKKHTGINVRRILFSELDAWEAYDGIWACASILHLPSAELKAVIWKMVRALKQGGWLYTSFKYGEFEGLRSERYFKDFTEQAALVFFEEVEGLAIREMWLTGDVRPGRGDEKWLNLMLEKMNAD